jgi:acetyl-CoA carboxylase biotin carboxyl carrier protein
VAIQPDVRELIELFNQSDLVELRVERGGRRLFLRKGDVPAAAVEAAPEPPAPEVSVTKAHMVGVFYWSKDKQAKPAVALEQQVEKGQIVGYIEAMGIMNELESSASGTVIEIAAANGQPMEYGQRVLVIDPASAKPSGHDGPLRSPEKPVADPGPMRST